MSLLNLVIDKISGGGRKKSMTVIETLREENVGAKARAEEQLQRHNELVLAFALVDKAMLGKKSSRKRRST